MKPIFRETKNVPEFRVTGVLDYPPHIHEDVELVYVRAGGGTVCCDGQEFTLQPGCFSVIFPHQVHRYTDCTGGEYVLLILKPGRLQHYGGRMNAVVPRQGLICPPPEEKQRLVSLLEMALEEYVSHGDSAVLDGYFTALLGGLLRCCPVEKTPAERDCLSTLLAYCGRHYREPLTVDGVARALHISRSHISHIMSSRLGLGFGAYINALRLTEAAELLEQEKFTVTEIAYRVGYASLRTFNRAFLRRYRQSPTTYRKQHRAGLQFTGNSAIIEKTVKK